MAHAQKPDLVFQRNGPVHLNRRGCQFSRLLAVEECVSADSNYIDRAPSSSARLLATHSIRIFPLHFPSRASPCAIRFRTRYTNEGITNSITTGNVNVPWFSEDQVYNYPVLHLDCPKTHTHSSVHPHCLLLSPTQTQQILIHL